jgi:DNA-binding transcriptional ArsR family regulator
MPDKTESARATLELSHNEERILARLARQGCLSKEQACAITARNTQPIVTSLRKKLFARGVALLTSYKFGWELSQKDREKVRELLAAHSTKAKPTRPIKTSPTGATEAAGAKSRREGRMPREQRARAMAT